MARVRLYRKVGPQAKVEQGFPAPLARTLGAMRNVVATPLSPTQVRLSDDLPEGDFVLRGIVRKRDDPTGTLGGPWQAEDAPGTRSRTFENLVPDTTYTVTTTPIDAAGVPGIATSRTVRTPVATVDPGTPTNPTADPLNRGLPVKFFTDFREGFLPDVFEPLGGGKPISQGSSAYLQPDGSANPYNQELQWMRPTNVRIQPSVYEPAEGNVLALITKGDGYTTTHIPNRTDPRFDFLLSRNKTGRAGRDSLGNPKYPYTGGMVSTQSDRITAGRPLVVDNGKEWIATARMRWRNMPGYWPAFWMMPDPISVGWVTERDVMEDFGTIGGDGLESAPNIVYANLWNNGSQLPYNNHKRRSLDLSQYHTWVVHNEPTGSQAAGHVGKARWRVWVDGSVFFDSDFYRQFADINVDAFLKPIAMHFIFQGAQIGGTGSNGGRPTTDPYYRDLGQRAMDSLPLVMEISKFGVWEAGATALPLVPVTGHPTTAPEQTGGTTPTDPLPPTSSPRLTAVPVAPTDIMGKRWQTTFLDDFTGTSLDRTKWSEYQEHQAGTVANNGGYSFDAFYPVPADVDKYGPGTRTIEIGSFHGASALRMKARRQPGVPSSDKWTTAQLFTHPGSHWKGGWLSPTTAGTKAEFYEARVRCQGGFGTSEQFWGLGPGRWPIGGEWDFMEMFNLDAGWLGIPHLSLHWPKDVYTNPPGTWLNDYHIGKGYRDPAGQLTLLNRWITIGCYRDANVIRGYVNGTQFVEYRRGESFNGSMPIPDVMFTGRMGIILGLGVGGYQGSAKPESEWQESDYYVDYAQSWVEA